MPAKKIQVAARELKRLVNSAVGRSFCKTVTEPLTNSDSATKDKLAVPHASGLIDAILGLRANDRIVSADLKARIAKRQLREILVELFPAKGAEREARLCRVTDTGPGMSREQLELNFGVYAEAKAKGRKTRSLFGRGALDVLLYHDNAKIYSVRDGRFSLCRIYWDPATREALVDVEDKGDANSALLAKHDADAIASSGTIVEFCIKEGTHIPQTQEVVGKLSSFYMLRLIAADPNARVVVRQIRSGGKRFEEPLVHDFPMGTVLGRFSDHLTLGADGDYPVDILLARADSPLPNDPVNIERRYCGLLFVDDNDAVLDLTLLPEHERNPFLQNLYGIVRITGMRGLLEAKLEAEDAVAVLTETRDGFNRKNEIAQKLFALVERHVKPLYEAEERRQRKGEGARSAELAKRVKEVLKVLNQFNAEETDDEGEGPPQPPKEPPAAIFFSVKTACLVIGVPRRAYVFVDVTKVNNGEIVLFESDNPDIRVEPGSDLVKYPKKQRCQRFELRITGNVKGVTGTVAAVTIGKEGQDLTATLVITGVDDAPVPYVPDDIEFIGSTISGDPNRANRAALLVNLDAFVGMPNITFWLEDMQGKITLGDRDEDRVVIKTLAEHQIAGAHAARVSVVFRGTGWGARAVLCAKAKKRDGELAVARCRLRFEQPAGTDKFTDFFYEDLKRDVLGDVAQDKLYINAGYSLHRLIFGNSQEQFDQRLETDQIAQTRAAMVLVEITVYKTATTRYFAGGKKGLTIEAEDPVGSVRKYVEESRLKLEPRVIRALAPGIGRPGTTAPLAGQKTQDPHTPPRSESELQARARATTQALPEGSAQPPMRSN